MQKSNKNKPNVGFSEEDQVLKLVKEYVNKYLNMKHYLFSLRIDMEKYVCSDRCGSYCSCKPTIERGEIYNGLYIVNDTKNIPMSKEENLCISIDSLLKEKM